MSKSLTTKNIAAVVLGLGLVLALSFSFATPVKAQSIADLQAQIQALLAQIQSLQGGTPTTGGACFTFTMNLTIGSTGNEVMQLQKFLNTHGAMVAASGAGSPGNETSYFGPATKAAVAKFQAANGIAPASGYFGPITRSKVNSMCMSGPVVPGPVTPGPVSPSGPLQGGAGSINDVDYISSLNNEEVGEGSEDVEVAGLEIEADNGSDIELTAVLLNFSKASANANDDFDDYVDEVSISLDGKELARVDASDFEDDDNFDRTISLAMGGIIRAGDTGDLVVTVSGAGNLDSDQFNDTWTLEFESVRFRDAQGASVTDSTTGDINDATGRTFSFKTFASAEDIELKARADSDTPEGIITVDDTNDTDGVEVLRFSLEAEGGDIRVRDLPITFATTSGNTATALSSIFSSAYVEIDGDSYSESVSQATSIGSSGATITFDDLDYTIEEGDKVDVIVTLDVNDTEAGSFVNGDGLTVSFTADNRGVLDAEDETGESLTDSSEKTGTGNGDAVAFYATGIAVTFVSASESVTTGNSSNDDVGTFTIKFNVEAVGDTVYVADTAEATTDTTPSTYTTNGGHQFVVFQGSSATVADVSSSVNYTTSNGAADSTNGNIALDEGDSTEITLTVSRTNNTTGDAGLYQAQLFGIEWSTTDSSGLATSPQLYTFDLDEFETDPISLN